MTVLFISSLPKHPSHYLFPVYINQQQLLPVLAIAGRAGVLSSWTGYVRSSEGKVSAANRGTSAPGARGRSGYGKEITGTCQVNEQSLVFKHDKSNLLIRRYIYSLQVPLGANGCAYFPFEELCDRPLGAADYFGLFSKHCFFIYMCSSYFTIYLILDFAFCLYNIVFEV